ncbi:MAG: HDOD domain-containing protein [Deltaproteobacteria bacterium]|nr:HDOD domain-containing protein [Deltaproteobacteria bacterium]
MLPKIEIDPKTFLHKHCSLPALPEVLTRIQNLAQGNNVDMGAIAALISADPSLVAEVLKVVNSAYYGLPHEISRVRAAIAYLGLHEVYHLVLSLSIIKSFQIGGKELREFWFHSYYTAVCAKHLARKFQPLMPHEELWSAAILHDIGKLVYLKFFPEHYQALQSYSAEQGCLFSQAEKHFSCPSSGYLGGLLCDHWRLPDSVRQACAFHTLDDLATVDQNRPPTDLQLMVSAGNLLAVVSTQRVSKDVGEAIAATTIRALNLTQDHFLPLIADIYELKSEAEDFLNQFEPPVTP